jgi:hypothetical protein
MDDITARLRAVELAQKGDRTDQQVLEFAKKIADFALEGAAPSASALAALDNLGGIVGRANDS